MRKIMIIIYFFEILFYIPNIYATEIELINEDFEAYTNGTFPSPNWNLQWNGAGNQYQVIVNSIYHSASQSMQIKSSSGWAVLAYRNLTQTPNVIYCELWMKSPEAQSSCESAGYISLYNPSQGSYGTTFGSFGMSNYPRRFLYFKNSNYPESLNLLDTFQFNTWYKIKFKFNLCCSLLSAWVNDIQVLNNEQITVNSAGTRYSCIAISSGGCGQYMFYYDDIRVWYDDEETAIESCLALSKNEIQLGVSLCGEQLTDTFRITNLSGSAQRIHQAYFKNNVNFKSNLASNFTLNGSSSINADISIVPGKFGTMSDSLILIPECGDTMMIKVMAIKDSINFAINNTYPDTLEIDLGVVCPGSVKDTTFTIQNKSTISTTLGFGSLDPPFSVEGVTAAKKEEEYEGEK